MIIGQYIFSNYVMLFELAGLLIMLRISAHISLATKKLTVAVVMLLFINSVIYNVERWTQTFERLSPARPILTACVYSIYPIVMILLMQVTVSDERRFTRDQMILLMIPEAISIPVFFTTQWTQFVCWFSDDNHWHGGPLRYWPYALFGLYCMILLIRNYRYFRNYSMRNRLVFYYIVFLPVAGVVGYMLLQISDDYSALFTSCVLMYYLYIYIQNALIDPLTHLYNLQKYYQDCRTLDSKITGVVNVDLNELKHINDDFNHFEGDKALITVSRILQTGCGTDGFAYRIGGDEFRLFFFGVSEETIEDSVKKMREQLAETPYSCAFGIALKDPDEALRDVVLQADERMYADKEQMKQEMEKKGIPLHMRD